MYHEVTHPATHNKAARPLVRWAVFASVVGLCLYLGWTWVAQGAMDPRIVDAVNRTPELPENIYALAVLSPDSPRQAVQSITGISSSSIAVTLEGQFVEGNDLPATLGRASGWFLPTTTGFLYVRDGDRVLTKRIAQHGSTLSIPMPYTAPMSATIHPDATSGTLCTDTCAGTHNISVPQDMELLVVGGNTVILGPHSQRDTLITYVEAITAFAIPLESPQRAQDGNTYTELVPAVDVSQETIAPGIRRIGSDTYGWFYNEAPGSDAGGMFILSTSQNILSEYINQLSTKTWTNKLCGRNPATFYVQDIPQTFAKNPTIAYAIVRSARSWSLCVK